MRTPVIDAATLHTALHTTTPPVLLDVRWSIAGGVGTDDYLNGHLPGAHFVDLNDELAAAPGDGGRHPVPPTDVFVAAMRRCGVGNDRPVVCYDSLTGMSAARAWWLLRYFGHGDASLLDGGYAAWINAGYSVVRGPDIPSHGTFTPAAARVSVLEAGDVLAFTERGQLLDARDTVRYLGESEPVDFKAGHIPGAVSAPTADNVGPDGRFLPADELRARFGSMGVDGSRPTAVYCGSGVTAAHEVVALEIAGVDAALYPGSWSHWITDPGRPVATGEQR